MLDDRPGRALMAPRPTAISSGVLVRSDWRGIGELGTLRVARAAINKLRALRQSVLIRRQAALDHRREILVNLLEDFANRRRMKDALAQPRAARQPMREVAAHLLELACEGALVQFIF